jgi:hypothetical protein
MLYKIKDALGGVKFRLIWAVGHTPQAGSLNDFGGDFPIVLEWEGVNRGWARSWVERVYRDGEFWGILGKRSQLGGVVETKFGNRAGSCMVVHGAAASLRSHLKGVGFWEEAARFSKNAREGCAGA